MNHVIPENLKNAVKSLGDAVLPFREWSNDQSVPSSIWNDETFIALEALISGSEFDANLSTRWQLIESNPLIFFPDAEPAAIMQNAKDWRKKLGLSDVPKFAMDALNKPLNRRGFYAEYWDKFSNAVASKKPKTLDEWRAFATDLLHDKADPHWVAGGAKSSDFMRMLVSDIFIVALGPVRQSNNQPNQSENKFLRTLGENRQAGNKHTVAQVDEATRKFRDQLVKVIGEIK